VTGIVRRKAAAAGIVRRKAAAAAADI